LAPKATTIKRLFVGSQVMPLGLPSESDWIAMPALFRSREIMKIRSVPVCDTEPLAPKATWVSVM